jgi:hypothetical protein
MNRKLRAAVMANITPRVTLCVRMNGAARRTLLMEEWGRLGRDAGASTAEDLSSFSEHPSWVTVKRACAALSILVRDANQMRDRECSRDILVAPVKFHQGSHTGEPALDNCKEE